MVIRTYEELRDALEKAGFVQIEEKIDEGEFKFGKWICHSGLLEIKKSVVKDVEIILNKNNLCTIDIDTKMKSKEH